MSEEMIIYINQGNVLVESIVCEGYEGFLDEEKGTYTVVFHGYKGEVNYD